MSDRDIGSLRLITWNVDRRVSVAVDQAAAPATRAPDVVALQEITVRTLPLWREALEAMGLPHVRASLPEPPPLNPERPRRMGVLLPRGNRAGRGGGSPAIKAGTGSITSSCRASCGPLSCAYHHDWREQGLSDHSALEVDVGADDGGYEAA